MIQEIKERWSKATPGPWKSISSKYEPETIHASNGKMIATISMSNSYANAAAIASAPADIAYLLQEIERMRKVLKDWETWEADWIRSDECWDTPSGLPRLNQELIDRMTELQIARNRALKGGE